MMRKLLSLFLSIGLMAYLAACSHSTSNDSSVNLEVPQKDKEVSAENIADEKAENEPLKTGQTLIAYFSWSGNTKTVANKIQEKTRADMFKITTVNEYSSDYDTVIDEAQSEQNKNVRPELNNTVDNMSEYDVVFIGYPIWWGDMPMALYTFLDTYDLFGKKIIPFCTHGGSGFSDTVSSIKSNEPDAVLLEGLAVNGNDADSSDDSIAEWISGLGITE